MSFISLEKQKKQQQLYLKEVKLLMYGFGDVINPLDESASLMEELLQEFILDLCVKVNAKTKKAPKTSHFLHVLSNDPKKYHRARELLTMDKELKNARAVFDIEEMAKGAI